MTSSRAVLRPVLAVIVALTWTFAAFMVSAFFSLGSESLGWLWVGALMALGLVAAVRVWGRPARGVAGGVAVAVALGLGVLTWYSSPPTHERLLATAETVEVPASWELVTEDEYGNTWCFQGCPRLDRDYSVPGDDLGQARTDVVARLEADGWDVNESEDGELSKGRWTVQLNEVTYSDTPRLSLTFSGG